MGAPIGDPFSAGGQTPPGGGQLALSNVQLPRVWIGYLLSFVALVAMLVAVEQHPELAKGELLVPPLYVFLPIFISVVYWLVCVYRLHVVVNGVSGWKHPISPARAVGFHFLPIYSLYWLYKWPRELMKFVNWRLQKPVVKPEKAGVMVFLSYVAILLLGPGGLFLLFFCVGYLNEWVKRALSTPMRGTEENSRQDD